MPQLPNHIIGLILNKAEISIDTYLEFKSYGIKPNKIKIPANIVNLLGKMHKRRNNQLNNNVYDSYTKSENELSIDHKIYLSNKYNEMVYVFRVHVMQNIYYETKTYLYNLNNGENLL